LVLLPPRYRLDYLFYGIFLPWGTYVNIFRVAALVTPRIINFRLATASASLRLMRSLRIYYSMLWGALLQLTALYVWLSYTVLSQLCTFSSRILFSHSSVRSLLVYCPFTALYVLFSYTALSLLCMFGSRILSSHSSVCSVLVYCPLTALYVWFSYTALSLLCTFGSLILPFHRSVCLVLVYCTINSLCAQADMLWLNHKATDYQSFLVCY